MTSKHDNTTPGVCAWPLQCMWAWDTDDPERVQDRAHDVSLATGADMGVCQHYAGRTLGAGTGASGQGSKRVASHHGKAALHEEHLHTSAALVKDGPA